MFLEALLLLPMALPVICRLLLINEFNISDRHTRSLITNIISIKAVSRECDLYLRRKSIALFSAASSIATFIGHSHKIVKLLDWCHLTTFLHTKCLSENMLIQSCSIILFVSRDD